MYLEKDFQIMTDIFLAHVPGLKALFLFGSYSRGTAETESDADIALIIEKHLAWKERKQLLNTLWNELGAKGYTVDIVIKQMDDFEKDTSLPVTLSHSILSEGRLLWKAA